MSNAILFLETMGQDASLRHATQDNVEDALAIAQVSAQLQSAVLGGDKRQLEMLLGATPNVCCVLMPKDNEDEEDEPKDDDEITASTEDCRFFVAA